MTLQDLTFQFDYIYWARDKVLQVVDKISQEDFVRDMKSSHKSIQETMVHMLGSEQLWTARWKGGSPTGRVAAADYPTVADVRRRWAETEAGVRAHLASMHPEDAQKIVSYKTIEGVAVEYPWWQTAFQVTNHSSYHRGQIVTMLRQLGYEGIGTDMIAYFKKRNATG